MRPAVQPFRLVVAAVAMAATCVPMLAWPLVAWADSEDLEAAVKAAYLTKLGDFVEWPPGTLPAGAFNLCVMGSSPFGDLLDRAVRGQTVQTHPIALHRLSAPIGNAPCQLVFVSGSSSRDISQVLDLERGLPVLTVTDHQRDTNSRGIVNFVTRDGRLRFQIDRKAAEASHLVISSKLLDLAVNLRE